MNANDQLFNADQYKNLIIGEKNGVPIPLSAVGHAIDGTEDRLQAAWFNSKRAVVLFVRKQADANVIETVDRMKAMLPQLERWLPPAIHLDIQSDRTVTIRASVADVQTSLLISVGLVVMVCFVLPPSSIDDVHRLRDRPARLGRHVRGDVSSQVQPRQYLSHGAHDLRRLRGG